MSTKKSKKAALASNASLDDLLDMDVNVPPSTSSAKAASRQRREAAKANAAAAASGKPSDKANSAGSKGTASPRGEEASLSTELGIICIFLL